jgi:hypothetical protein
VLASLFGSLRNDHSGGKLHLARASSMDDLNVQQLWGISPFVDLLAAATAGPSSQHGHLETAAVAAGASAVWGPTAVLQVRLSKSTVT